MMVDLLMTVRDQRPAYLLAAVTSIRAQTLPEWRLLVWDDGSAGPLPALPADDRIVVARAPALGRWAAVDAALRRTAAPYVALVDSDDLWAPEALEAALEVLERDPGLAYVYSRYEVLDETAGGLRRPGRRCEPPFSLSLLAQWFIAFGFRLMRREALWAAGGVDLAFPVAGDYDLALRMAAVGGVRKIERVLYTYRVHPDSLSARLRAEQQRYARLAQRRAVAWGVAA
jgi:GT2 family glycosyltransferase